MSMPVGKKAESDEQTPRPKRGPNVFLIVCTIILLLALGISGLLFLLRSQGNAASPMTNKVTPTPTPTEISTVTPPPQSVFYDTFVNNDLGWSLSNTAGYIRTLSNGMLTLTDTNPNTTLVESLPTDTTWDNFMVTVDFTIVKASREDSAGIYLRGDSNLDHDYRVEINGDGTFDIAKENLDTNEHPSSTILDGPHTSSALHRLGEQNTLMVIMTGPHLVLFINNVEVSSITDTDYATGQVALFVRADETSSTVTASFGKIEVDRPPDQIPG